MVIYIYEVFVVTGDTGSTFSGWPRYNKGSDTTVNGEGLSGYGEYGLNVGVGKLNNTHTGLQIVTTFDGQYPLGALE